MNSSASGCGISTGDLTTERLQLENKGKDYAALKPQLRKLIALGDDAIRRPKNRQKAGKMRPRGPASARIRVGGAFRLLRAHSAELVSHEEQVEDVDLAIVVHVGAGIVTA